MNIQKRLIAFAFMLGISSVAWGAIPPPPVNQNMGIPDTVFSFQDASLCKACHHASANDETPLGNAPVLPGLNPDRHHSGVMQPGVEARLADGQPDFPPFRDANNDGVPDELLTCLSCHEILTDPVTGEQVYEVNSKDQVIRQNFRNCLNCHKWEQGGLSVHHKTERALQGNCFQCHGGIVRGIDVETNTGKKPDPVNPGQTVPVVFPDYIPSMITPWTSNKPNGDDTPEMLSSAGQKPGSCAYCHNTATGSSLNPDGSGGTPEQVLVDAENDTYVMVDIFTNKDNHHGTGFFGEGKCAWCHTSDGANPAVFNATSIRTCQNCHDIPTLHNIEFDAVGDGLQPGQEEPFFGHVGNTANCWGCHGNNNTVQNENGEWVDPITLEVIINQSLDALGDPAKSTAATVPTLTTLSEQRIGNGTDTVITATGQSFVNTGLIKTCTGCEEVEHTWTSEVMLTDSKGNVTMIEPNTQDYGTLEFTLPASTPLGIYEVVIKKAYQHTSPLMITVVPEVMTNQSFVYTTYGSLAVISGKGFTNAREAAPFTPSISLTDQNGTEARRIYIWRDDFIVAHFYDTPESVTVKTLFDEKVIPLSSFPAQ